MIIREAKDVDIPEIVEVLKASLGEQDLPLSEGIWNYKHNSNPFGRSLVLIAEENGIIAGVRAFMCWKWQYLNKSYSTYRAVDTATHPDFQGKGIFKKLTLKAIELAKQQGDQFIFNTPNEQSRPGYLKIGWETVDKLKVALKPAYNSFWKFNKTDISYSVDNNSKEKDLQLLCKLWNSKLETRQGLFTPKSVGYLQWRYQANPLQQYEVFIDTGIYMAGHVKKRRGFKELRIAECVFDDNEINKKKINSLIKLWCSKFGIQVISYSPEVLNLNLTLVNSKIGPILTLRELNLTRGEFETFKKVTNWNYSLGDLELF